MTPNESPVRIVNPGQNGENVTPPDVPKELLSDAEQIEADDKNLSKTMATDGDYQRETVRLYIKRHDDHIVIGELTDTEVDTIQEMQADRIIDARGRRRKMMSEIARYAVANALVEPNLTGMTPQQLEKKYQATTPEDAVRNIFKPFEVIAIFDRVMELAGAGDDAVQDAKN